MAYRFVVNAPIHCAILLGNYFWKAKVKIIIYFILILITFVSRRENLASSPDTLDLSDPAYDAK